MLCALFIMCICGLWLQFCTYFPYLVQNYTQCGQFALSTRCGLYIQTHHINSRILRCDRTILCFSFASLVRGLNIGARFLASHDCEQILACACHILLFHTVDLSNNGDEKCIARLSTMCARYSLNKANLEQYKCWPKNVLKTHTDIIDKLQTKNYITIFFLHIFNKFSVAALIFCSTTKSISTATRWQFAFCPPPFKLGYLHPCALFRTHTFHIIRQLL